MRGFWQFLLAHPIPGVAAFLGWLIGAGSLTMDAVGFVNLGIPVAAWGAIGWTIFAGAVVSILFRWYNENIAPDARCGEPIRGRPASDVPGTPTAKNIAIQDKSKLAHGAEQRSLFGFRLDADFDMILDRKIIYINIQVYNASPNAVFINEIRGMVVYEGSAPGEMQEPLSPPTFKSGSDRSIPPWSERIVALEQRIPGAMVEEMEHRRMDTKVCFDLRQLVILWRLENSKAEESVRLKIWDGFICCHKAQNLTARVIQGSASSRL